MTEEKEDIMVRLLFVEDEPESVEPAIRWLNRGGTRYECKVTSFGDAQKDISAFLPDIVVLDLLEEGAEGDLQPVGMKTYDYVWSTRFCPLVVYSARPDILSNERPWHPFVKSVQKGSGSPAELETAVAALAPHVTALHDAEQHMWHSFACAMREVAPYAFADIPDANQQKDVLLRCGRRRVAALMDDLSHQGGPLASWEHYLCPPVSSDVLLADILRVSAGKSDEPSAFRVVLTPSCDLVISGGRTPKVDLVLVAQCCPAKEGISATSLCKVKPEGLKDAIGPMMLTQGYLQKIIPFPCLPSRIPTMMADLKKLELLPLSEIGRDTKDKKKYIRVASLDSPFRELISWAYMQIACRPGLPDRDVVAWAKEIMRAIDNGSTKA
jgi:hypothetical protein